MKTNKPKTVKQPEILTINGISLAHKIDRRTLTRYLDSFPVAKTERGVKYYNVSEAIRHVEGQMASNHKANPETVALRQQKIFEEVRKLRLENDAREELSVSRDKVRGAIRLTVQAARQLLESKLENEYPALVSGLDIAGARVKGRQLGDAIVAEFQKMGSFWEI